MKASITPEVLRWAREKRVRLQIDSASEKLKVKPDQLESWEAGTDRPTFAQLKKAANVYKTHVSVFYLPEPPGNFEALTDHRNLPKLHAPNPEQSYRLNANIIEAYERREVFIEFYQLLEEPPPEVTLELSEDDTPGHAAEEVANFLHFNTRALQACTDSRSALKFWRHIVGEFGILVCQTSANTHLSVELETVRGFCIAQKPLPVIVVNPKDSPYGRIFTIVHELVHIGLGKSIMQNTNFEAEKEWNRTEAFCNQVAAEVLVPTDELTSKVNFRTIKPDISQLSNHFRVSPEVIMRRLLTLEHISRQEYQEFRKSQKEKYKDISKTGGSIPYHVKLLNVAGEHFARTAFTAYYQQKITLADLAASFSKCDPKHIPKIESVIFT